MKTIEKVLAEYELNCIDRSPLGDDEGDESKYEDQ